MVREGISRKKAQLTRHLEISLCNRCGAVVSNVEQHIEFHLVLVKVHRPELVDHNSALNAIERRFRSQIARIGQVQVLEQREISWERDDPYEAASD
jgi:hypothetical protein